MADSFVTYTGDGTTTIFSIPFDYLDNTHVVAFVDGVETSITFPSVAQAEFSVAPADTVNVTLKRVTPRTVREVVWQNAANLSAGDLNTSDLQLLYITQESFDAVDSNISLDTDDTFDALGKRIKNVATPTDGNDAVNKTYADAILSQITSEVTDAETAATAAELAESNAEAILAQMVILYDDWDDRYLGSKASDPSVDNDGDTLEDGALYFNTTVNQLRVYDLGSTSWLIIDNTIAANSVSNTELSDMAVDTIKGRVTSGTGDPEDLTPSQARTVMDVYSVSEVDSAISGATTTTYESSEITLTPSASGNIAHGLGSTPKKVWGVFICKTAENGYSVGDEISTGVLATPAGGASYGAFINSNATNVSYAFSSGAYIILGIPKGGGGAVGFTDARWKLILRWQA